MRKSFLLTLILIAAAAVSCNGSSSDNKTEANEDPTPKPGKYKFVAPPLKGSWSAGDKIYVHGSMGAFAEVVTLSSSDISSDGTTATAQLGSVTEYTIEPDYLYAAWPDEAVNHIKGKMGNKTSFSSCDRALGVAYLDKDTFSFIDASGSISFSVTGDYDRFALAGNGREGIVISDFQVEYTSETTVFTQKDNSGYPFISGDLSSGKTNQLWFSGGMSFPDGISIYLSKNDSWTSVCSIKDKIKVTAGNNVDLGDITASIKPYDGPAPKMPQMGKITKYDVDFNELSGICLSADGTFLWGMGDDGSIARLSFEGEVLEEHWIGCDLEAVTIDPRNGDLIVGIEDLFNPKDSGQEIWSWNGVGRIASSNFNAVEGLFRISAAKSYDNAGIEGVTYYKNGIAYAGAQANSHLFICDIDQKIVVSDIKLREVFPQITEIADLCYDPLTDWLWIIDSEAKKFFALTGDASEMLGYYSTGNIANPEAIFVDHVHNCIWVGDDYGDISHLYRFDFTGLDDAIIQ